MIKKYIEPLNDHGSSELQFIFRVKWLTATLVLLFLGNIIEDMPPLTQATPRTPGCCGELNTS